MPKGMNQKPIWLQAANLGTVTQSIVGYHVPGPPDDWDEWESNQVFEWMALTSWLRTGNPITSAVSGIMVYADRWSIPVEVLAVAEFTKMTQQARP